MGSKKNHGLFLSLTANIPWFSSDISVTRNIFSIVLENRCVGCGQTLVDNESNELNSG